MEISVVRNQDSDQQFIYESFTVTLMADKPHHHRRIFTIVTDSHLVIKKWIERALEASKDCPPPLIVGVSVDREHRLPSPSIFLPLARDLRNPYTTLQLCFGSHCLIYLVPYYSSSNLYLCDKEFQDIRRFKEVAIPRSLHELFSNRELTFVGLNIGEVSRKLEHVYDLKMWSYVEIESLIGKGLGFKEGCGYLKGCGLDDFVKIEFGEDWKVVRPVMEVEWWDYEGLFRRMMNLERVKFLTVDAYLCFKIGFKLSGKVATMNNDGNGGVSGSKRKRPRKSSHPKQFIKPPGYC